MVRDGDVTDLAAGDIEELCSNGGKRGAEVDEGAKVGLGDGMARLINGIMRWVFGGGAGNGEGEAVSVVV